MIKCNGPLSRNEGEGMNCTKPNEPVVVRTSPREGGTQQQQAPCLTLLTKSRLAAAVVTNPGANTCRGRSPCGRAA